MSKSSLKSDLETSVSNHPPIPRELGWFRLKTDFTLSPGGVEDLLCVGPDSVLKTESELCFIVIFEKRYSRKRFQCDSRASPERVQSESSASPERVQFGRTNPCFNVSRFRF